MDWNREKFVDQEIKLIPYLSVWVTLLLISLKATGTIPMPWLIALAPLWVTMVTSLLFSLLLWGIDKLRECL